MIDGKSLSLVGAGGELRVADGVLASALPLRVHGQALHFGSGGPPTISAPLELHWL